MTETTPSSRPLTDQALSRLRKLADGNGLAPNKIQLVESVEKVYALEGILQLTPYCTHESGRHAGTMRGVKRITMPDAASLHEAAQGYQKQFLNGREWLADAMKEIEDAPGNGWGLEGAKVTLPDRSKIFTTSVVCPACKGSKVFACGQCQSQGFLVCRQCEGRGFELCYNCAGRGVNPAHPNQPCAVCFGKRYAPCRFCRSTGKVVCPDCQGRGNTICGQCGGVGQFTEEVALNCGVSISFAVKGQELPSGLRRGLDRLGIANLIKGYADVRPVVQKKDAETETSGPPLLRYEAMMPYADLKIRFGEKARAVMVNVFGKRGSLMSVPPFLDDALAPARQRLKEAARGETPLEKALDARAMREALAFELRGEGNANNLRRLYPVGLSGNAAQQIFLDMRTALDRHTRDVRMAVAAFGSAIGITVLAGFMLAPQHAQLTHKWPWVAGLLLDLFVLALVMSCGWIGLGVLARTMLQRRFPKLKISLHQNVGTIGAVMLTVISIAWIIIILLMPERPLWVLRFFGSS